ncbi:MAG: EVE domain-containing protein [Chitinophagales bacterium]
MNYWLVKSDPETYGWQELSRDKKTEWSGVRSYAARNHLRTMKKNDLVLFYHSGKVSAVVGIVKVTKEAFQDPTTDDQAWVAVQITAVKALQEPVTLSMIKSRKELNKMNLLKISRLSVQPVTEQEFYTVMEIGKL